MRTWKRALAGTAVAAAFALSVVVAPMASAAGNSSATGGGTTEEGGAKSTFVFSAVQQKNGAVTGNLVYHVRAWDLTIMMDLDCLMVVGNAAAISGVVTKVSPEGLGVYTGEQGLFYVVDNGQGANAAPDLLSDLYLGPGASCDLGFIPGYDPYIPVSGNIQVR
jgi:hypothetical protein